jgi:hypothetical protein
MLKWLQRLWEYKGPLPRGLDSMDVPPPEPTSATPEELMESFTKAKPYVPYDG